MSRKTAMRLGAAALVLLAAVLVWTGQPPGSRPPSTSEAPAQVPADASVEASAPAAPHLPRAARDDARPDLLLFTIDTVRADHVWSYGGARHTTPTMSRLASEGTQYARAYSTSSWTVPAVSSLVTGVLPSEHGVQHGFWLEDAIANQEELPAALPTLAELLQRAGYRTMGVVANLHLGPSLGYARGFDRYTGLGFDVTAREIDDEVERHLEELTSGSEPYFLWVHLIEPHAPYAPRRPVFDEYWAPSEPQYPSIDTFALEEFLPALFAREHIPLPRGIGYAMAAYDSEIHDADAYLGRLLDRIDDPRLGVVVTSDHGEELFDHLRFGHGHTGYEEGVRVPLVVRLPEGAAAPRGRVVDARATLLDVMPTLLELASVDRPSHLAGQSLVASARGGELEERDVIIETGRGREVVRAIVSGHYKYGERVTPEPIRGLFDLDADPREVHNLVETEPALADELRARLTAAIDAAAARRPPTHVVPAELDDVQREQLRALGYGN